MTWSANISGHEDPYSEENQKAVAKALKDAIASFPASVQVSGASFSGNALSGDLRELDL